MLLFNQMSAFHVFFLKKTSVKAASDISSICQSKYGLGVSAKQTIVTVINVKGFMIDVTLVQRV